MPQGHKTDCACSVCTQKRNGVARLNTLDRKRVRLATLQRSHETVKGLTRWQLIAQYTDTGAAVAYNVSRIAVWTIPTAAGAFALLRFVSFLFSF